VAAPDAAAAATWRGFMDPAPQAAAAALVVVMPGILGFGDLNVACPASGTYAHDRRSGAELVH
jgi:hypothetical protein